MGIGQGYDGQRRRDAGEIKHKNRSGRARARVVEGRAYQRPCARNHPASVAPVSSRVVPTTNRLPDRATGEPKYRTGQGWIIERRHRHGGRGAAEIKHVSRAGIAGTVSSNLAPTTTRVPDTATAEPSPRNPGRGLFKANSSSPVSA